MNLSHAAGESSPGDLPPGTNVVLLAVPDEAALEQLARRLARAGVAHVRCAEPDAPWCGQLMSIGLAPGRKEVLRRHVGGLPLLG